MRADKPGKQTLAPLGERPVPSEMAALDCLSNVLKLLSGQYRTVEWYVHWQCNSSALAEWKIVRETLLAGNTQVLERRRKSMAATSVNPMRMLRR